MKCHWVRRRSIKRLHSSAVLSKHNLGVSPVRYRRLEEFRPASSAFCGWFLSRCDIFRRWFRAGRDVLTNLFSVVRAFSDCSKCKLNTCPQSAFGNSYKSSYGRPAPRETQTEKQSLFTRVGQLRPHILFTGVGDETCMKKKTIVSLAKVNWGYRFLSTCQIHVFSQCLQKGSDFWQLKSFNPFCLFTNRVSYIFNDSCCKTKTADAASYFTTW